MSEAMRLSPAQLRQCCDAASLVFATTDELEELEGFWATSSRGSGHGAEPYPVAIAPALRELAAEIDAQT